jgi:hypothetical protein
MPEAIATFYYTEHDVAVRRRRSAGAVWAIEQEIQIRLPSSPLPQH